MYICLLNLLLFALLFVLIIACLIVIELFNNNLII